MEKPKSVAPVSKASVLPADVTQSAIPKTADASKKAVKKSGVISSLFERLCSSDEDGVSDADASTDSLVKQKRFYESLPNPVPDLLHDIATEDSAATEASAATDTLVSVESPAGKTSAVVLANKENMSLPGSKSSDCVRALKSGCGTAQDVARAVSVRTKTQEALVVAESDSCNKIDSCESAVTFRDLGLCEELCAACEALGWSAPTEIQAASLPHSLKGCDIIGLAETGSGKTAAFALPVLQKLLENPRHRNVAALVLTPTRELTMQIAEQFLALGCSIGLKVATIVGGLDMVAQAMELTKKPHVVVGTPGRIVDHLENTKGFSLGSILTLVMDEADRLLSMDFEDALDKILQVLPKNRNTYLFSATMTSRVSKLQRASLVNPVKISVNSKYETAKNLVQNMKIVSHKYKWTYCVALLTHFKAYTCIVFTNTCLDAKRLAICLRHLGFVSVCLHGKMTQPQRLGALNGFKAGRKRILVATEVGSRGLDIPHVDIVINFDVPLGSKDYIHRVGRTARAGKTGRAITLVTQYDAETYLKIEQALGKKLKVYEAVSDDMWEPLIGKVEEARRAAELEIKESAAETNGQKGKKKRRRI